MRRTRFQWFHVLFLVPAIAIGYGAYHFTKKPGSEWEASNTGAVTKPSFFKSDSGAGTESRASRVISAAKKALKKGLEDLQAKPAPAKEVLMADAKGKPNDKADAKAKAEAKKVPAPTEVAQGVVNALAQNAPAAPMPPVDAARAPASEAVPGQCASIEYRGDGPTATNISQKEWSDVIDQFLAAKKDMLDWLEKNKKGFTAQTVAVMEKRMRALKVQRPPVAEEPDLAWRGIAVWSQDSGQAPVIRLSPGFVKLVAKEPARAKFEMTRVVAQTWAPCELKKHEAAEIWAPLLSCLQVKDRDACGPSSYSEEGWAVSSALASVIAPAGCTVPAFANPTIAQCLKKLPEHKWMEASR